MRKALNVDSVDRLCTSLLDPDVRGAPGTGWRGGALRVTSSHNTCFGKKIAMNRTPKDVRRSLISHSTTHLRLCPRRARSADAPLSVVHCSPYDYLISLFSRCSCTLDAMRLISYCACGMGILNPVGGKSSVPSALTAGSLFQITAEGSAHGRRGRRRGLHTRSRGWPDCTCFSKRRTCRSRPRAPRRRGTFCPRRCIASV